MKLLIIEDEPATAVELARIVEALGHDALLAIPDGAGDVADAGGAVPDLALIDIDLGAVDGVAAAHTVRARYKCPVVFVTAHSAPSVVRRAASVRPNGYVLKPFTEDEIFVAVETALANHTDDLMLDPVARREALGEGGGLGTAALRAVLDHMERRFADNITVDTLARMVGLSRAHFGVRFREATGTTAHAHLTHLRMAEARRLLLTTRWPVARVARAVGYRRAPYFAQLFERHTGYGPAALRAAAASGPG